MVLKKITIAAFIAMQISAFAQSQKVVKTRVQKATVFLQGAQLSSTETVSLGVGVTDVVFEDVSPYLVQNSIQASGKGTGDFIILDTRYHLKYAEKEKNDPEKAPTDPNKARYERELKVAHDSLVDIDFTLQGLQQQKNNLTAERNILLSNKMMRGEYQRDSLRMFMQGMDYLRQRLNNIDAEGLKLDKELYRINKIKTPLTARIQELNQLIAGNYPPSAKNASPKPVSQVIVTIQCETPTTAQVNISYFVANAGWTPSYDLKASKEAANVDLRHKAAVYQNTGIDWKDVQLTLSTGNPNTDNTKPVLTPFYIAYDNPYAQQFYNNNNNNSLRNTTAVPGMAMQQEKLELDNSSTATGGAPPRDAADFVNVNNGLMFVEYEIKLKYNIPSDNQQHNVAIQNKTMPASYNYSVVPKIDPTAFLIARVTGWEDMNLIPGNARVYFDGSFVGETAINPNSTNDTLLLNLGRDKSIAVSRIKVKDRNKEKVVTDTKVVTKTYEIMIRNTKNIPVRMIVEDQIPITTDNSIKIEKLEDSAAAHNPETGKLTWDFTLRPRDTKRIIFSYEVKYPKDKQVSRL